jgi:uncharacterized protein (DUF934 family)
MAHLIRHGRIEKAAWRRLDEAGLRQLGAGEPVTEGPLDGVLIPFKLWQAERTLCGTLGVEIGVLVRDDDDLTEVAEQLPHINMIAVDFPKFTNGRGYSIARLLRGRYGYTRELCAIGDIMRDQMFYLSRVGFDAFELRADQDAQISLDALRDFSAPYQASADQPVPLFKRRVA